MLTLAGLRFECLTVPKYHMTLTWCHVTNETRLAFYYVAYYYALRYITLHLPFFIKVNSNLNQTSYIILSKQTIYKASTAEVLFT